jgi:hypothetical protein
MLEPNDEALLRDAAPEDEGIPDTEDQPPGKILSGETPEGMVPPRDHPLGADEFGTTAAEESAGESFARRVAREEPDSLAGVLADDDDGRPLAGRLVQPDLGMVDTDDTPEEVADAVPDVVGLSAEEAAMRVETDPEGMGGGWPGYVDEEQD